MEITIEIVKELKATNTPDALKNKYIELTKKGYKESYQVFCQKLCQLDRFMKMKEEHDNLLKNEQYQTVSQDNSYLYLKLKSKNYLTRLLLKLVPNRFLIMN